MLGMAALIIIAATQARAEADVSTFLKTYDAARPTQQQTLREYLLWNYNGMDWANSSITLRDNRPLYCIPGKLALTGEQLVDMLRREAQEHPTLWTKPVGLVLLYALNTIFPCAPPS
jgi:hypothetical protein